MVVAEISVVDADEELAVEVCEEFQQGSGGAPSVTLIARTPGPEPGNTTAEP
ncbi:MAG: hypothetical protein IT379_39640 [Deltaproteobacteria bacterium]|nr:hypothetical protein [Deltaproteobacteria bacterium]